MRPDKTAFWVRRDQKQEARDKLSTTKDKFEKFDAGCLFVVDANGQPCEEPVNNLCHTIPRKPVLTPLSNRGQVLEVFWGFGNFFNLFVQGSEDNPVDIADVERYRPRPIGIDEASCGRFACKNSPTADHDGEFAPIDLANPDFNDPLVAFLVQYRADLWALYQIKRADSLIRDYNREIMRQSLPAERNQWMKYKTSVSGLLPFTQEKVSREGIHGHTYGSSSNSDFEVVAGRQFHFRSKLTFAACVFYGQSSVASVFPAGGDLHQMGITNLVEHTQRDAELTNGLIEVATDSTQKDDYGVGMMALLRDLSSGSVVMSPESYANLPEAERNVINQWVQQLAQADAMAKNINSRLMGKQRPGEQGRRRR